MIELPLTMDVFRSETVVYDAASGRVCTCRGNNHEERARAIVEAMNVALPPPPPPLLTGGAVLEQLKPEEIRAVWDAHALVLRAGPCVLDPGAQGPTHMLVESFHDQGVVSTVHKLTNIAVRLTTRTETGITHLTMVYKVLIGGEVLGHGAPGPMTIWTPIPPEFCTGIETYPKASTVQELFNVLGRLQGDLRVGGGRFVAQPVTLRVEHPGTNRERLRIFIAGDEEKC